MANHDPQDKPEMPINTIAMLGRAYSLLGFQATNISYGPVASSVSPSIAACTCP